jgi:hypothetical protein
MLITPFLNLITLNLISKNAQIIHYGPIFLSVFVSVSLILVLVLVRTNGHEDQRHVRS